MLLYPQACLLCGHLSFRSYSYMFLPNSEATALVDRSEECFSSFFMTAFNTYGSIDLDDCSNVDIPPGTVLMATICSPQK